MKIANKFIIALLLGVLTLSSCSYLDKRPDTEYQIDMVFEARNQVDDWLAAVYQDLSNPMWDWGRNHGIEVLADDMYFSYGWNQYWGNITTTIYGNWTITTRPAANYWERYSRAIRQAYIFMDRVHALPESGLMQDEADQMKLEARFLAAYFWWVMAREYGAIPFRPNYIAPTDAGMEELMFGQVPFDEVVDWLDKEFLEIAALLPAKYADTGDYGHITSVICHTVRSKMLLFAASPLANGGSELTKDWKNVDGVPILAATYDANKWVKARDAIKTLLDIAHEAGHKLYVVNNPDGSVDPFMSLQDLWFTPHTSGNTECLWPWTKVDNGQNFEEYTRHGMSHAADTNGNGGMGVYQGLIDAFFMSNGLPIDAAGSGYMEDGFTTNVETRNTRWIGGGPNPGNVTLEHTYNMYANREPRFYTAVTFNGSWLASVDRRVNFLRVSDGEIRTNVDNNGTHDAPQNGYLLRKKTDPNDNNRDQGNFRGRNGFNTMIYRLAASYLDYAEALNEASNDGAARREAIQYVNLIRQRAGIRQYTFDGVPASDPNFIQLTDSQAEVRKAVRAERRVELCTEGSRWEDIRRWMIAGENPEMTGAPMGMNFQAYTEADFYQRVPAGSGEQRVWDDKYYWQCVLLTDMDENPNLVQAPGW